MLCACVRACGCGLARPPRTARRPNRPKYTCIEARQIISIQSLLPSRISTAGLAQSPVLTLADPEPRWTWPPQTEPRACISCTRLNMRAPCGHIDKCATYRLCNPLAARGQPQRLLRAPPPLQAPRARCGARGGRRRSLSAAAPNRRRAAAWRRPQIKRRGLPRSVVPRAAGRCRL